MGKRCSLGMTRADATALYQLSRTAEEQASKYFPFPQDRSEAPDLRLARRCLDSAAEYFLTGSAEIISAHFQAKVSNTPVVNLFGVTGSTSDSMVCTMRANPVSVGTT